MHKRGGHAPGPARGHFFCIFACSSGDIESTKEVGGAGRTSGACVSSEKEGMGGWREGGTGQRERRTTPRFHVASTSIQRGGAGGTIWHDGDE